MNSNKKILFASIIFILILACLFSLMFRIKELANVAEFNVISFNGLILASMFLSFTTVILFLVKPKDQIEDSQVKVENEKSEETKESGNQENEKDEKQDKKVDINEKEIEERSKKLIPQKTSDIKEYSEVFLLNLAKEFDIVQGIMYVKNLTDGLFEHQGLYAYYSQDDPQKFKEGESLPGQVVKNKQKIYLTNVPENYIDVLSGLGKSTPKYLLLNPVVHGDITIGVCEISSFKELSEMHILVIEKACSLIAPDIDKFMIKPEKKKTVSDTKNNDEKQAK